MPRLIPDSLSNLASKGNKLSQKVREAANQGGALASKASKFAQKVKQGAAGDGSVLPADLQHRLETSLGEKLSDVRIHQNHKATLAGAVAYAQGQDIFFAPGQFQPHTNQGFELLSHEISHVVQQRAGHNNLKIPKGMAQILDMADLPKFP